MTVLMALSSIIMEQTKATEQTMERCTQLLDYLAGHADPKVRFNLSDMTDNEYTLGRLISFGSKSLKQAISF